MHMEDHTTTNTECGLVWFLLIGAALITSLSDSVSISIRVHLMGVAVLLITIHCITQKY